MCFWPNPILLENRLEQGVVLTLTLLCPSKTFSLIITFTSTLNLVPPVLYRWETCVRSVSGTDGSGLYFLEGSLTNAVGAMYAKVRNPPF